MVELVENSHHPKIMEQQKFYQSQRNINNIPWSWVVVYITLEFAPPILELGDFMVYYTEIGRSRSYYTSTYKNSLHRRIGVLC